MKKIWKKNICVLAIGLLISCCLGINLSQASGKHTKEQGHEKRQLESHEHGVSTLKIA